MRWACYLRVKHVLHACVAERVVPWRPAVWGCCITDVCGDAQQDVLQRMIAAHIFHLPTVLFGFVTRIVIVHFERIVCKSSSTMRRVRLHLGPPKTYLGLCPWIGAHPARMRDDTFHIVRAARLSPSPVLERAPSATHPSFSANHTQSALNPRL